MRSRLIGNPSGFNVRIGLVIACGVSNHVKQILKEKTRLNLNIIQEAQVRTCCRTSESNGCVRVVFRNSKGSNARIGLLIAWEEFKKHKFKLVVAQLRTCCCTSESNGCVRVVFGNPKGSNARMGLVIAWEVCQVMSKNILKGERRLNHKRIQEVQVRTCCRTSESNECVRAVLGFRVDVMLEWEM
ncbi:uncharacterized protein G2W53_009894 [Senna tora]|uniref:Uncharacterized protein n=1 Tax=Senna tora TaxID=362788 RepID=A0A835CAM4_9FABA|nr:uncharacterized protein G2W53_009894 [Senna tora]